MHRLPHLFGDLQERLDQPPGVEYAWFNNVETKPGIGYPKEWENQDRWNGGWLRKADGSIVPRIGGKWLGCWRSIFANPNLPEIDDYYEPFTFDYAPAVGAGDEGFSPAPVRAPDHRRADGEDRWGPNWEEILGGEFAKRSKDNNFDGSEGDLRPVREHLHDVPAAAVRALPEPGLRGRLPLRARSTSARKTASS